MEYAALYFAIQSMIPERILLVRYEDIVRKPEKHIKKLCDYAHLDYNPGILQGGGFRLPEYTAAQHAQVGKAPDPSNIDKWKKKLSEKELLVTESYCGTLMEAFGYDRLTEDCYSVGFRDKLSAIFGESYAYLINKIRKRKREQSA
jgi:hypothetical protein